MFSDQILIYVLDIVFLESFLKHSNSKYHFKIAVYRNNVNVFFFKEYKVEISNIFIYLLEKVKA